MNAKPTHEGELSPSHTRCTPTVWLLTGVLLVLIVAGFVLGSIFRVWWYGWLVVLAIIPGVVMVFVMYGGKNMKYAPVDTMATAFLLGIVVVIPIALMEFGVLWGLHRVQPASAGSVLLLLFVEAFFVVALLEEGGKWLIAHRAEHNPHLTEPYGIILYAMAGALGFATLENLAYVVGTGGTAAFQVAVLRGLIAVPLHGMTGALIGCGLAKRAFSIGGGASVLSMMGPPIFFHGAYDFFLFIPESSPFQDGGLSIVCIICAFIVFIALWVTTHVQISRVCKDGESVSTERDALV